MNSGAGSARESAVLSSWGICPRLDVVGALLRCEWRSNFAGETLTAGAVAVGCSIAYLISNRLFAIITQPLREVGHGKLMLIGTGVGEAFFTELKVSLTSA